MNHETGRSRGTAFVRYTKTEAAKRCLAAAAEGEQAATAATAKEKDKKKPSYRSVLQDEQDESAGGLWLDGRRLAVTVAVDRSRAKELTEKSKEKRDKRNLYLSREGSTAMADTIVGRVCTACSHLTCFTCFGAAFASHHG